MKSNISLFWFWLIPAAWMAFSYLAVNFLFPGLLPWEFNLYFSQPLLWLILIGMIAAHWYYFDPKPRFDKKLIVSGLLAGIAQVLIFFAAGLLLNSFGKSPYGNRIIITLANLFYVITMLVGFEISRAYFGFLFGKRNPILCLVIISIVYTFLGIPFNQFVQVNGVPGLFELFGNQVFPGFSENILATFLAMMGGPAAALAYRGVLLLFEWLPPILPNLSWQVTAFLGTLIPLIALFFINNQYSTLENKKEKQESRKNSKGTYTDWILVFVFAVGLIWFNTGMLGVRPFLINGNSMYPVYSTGDIVITREVPVDSIKVNDIIRYELFDNFIVHRVLEIRPGSDGRLEFITRGDNNNSDDQPVYAEQIQGRVIFNLPKVGLISIFLHDIYTRVAG